MSLQKTGTKSFLQKPIEEFGWKNSHMGIRCTFVKNARPKNDPPGITKTRNGKKKMSIKVISITRSAQEDLNIFRLTSVLSVVNLIPEFLNFTIEARKMPKFPTCWAGAIYSML